MKAFAAVFLMFFVANVGAYGFIDEACLVLLAVEQCQQIIVNVDMHAGYRPSFVAVGSFLHFFHSSIILCGSYIPVSVIPSTYIGLPL